MRGIGPNALVGVLLAAALAFLLAFLFAAIWERRRTSEPLSQ